VSTLFYSPWEDDFLMDHFETHIVPELLRSDWVKELQEEGLTSSEIEDEIWKEFPDWALEYEKNKKEELLDI